MSPPAREVRARYDDETLTVYQAYSPAIADAALAAGTFVAPFKRERMTWIKPSFRWMMYRSSWGTAPGQERVLAVRITRSGFEWALGHACLSAFERDVYATYEDWTAAKAHSPVRVQWDPERSPALAPLPYRAIQVGLSGEAVDRYVTEWIVGIEDVTPLAHEVRRSVATAPETVGTLLPVERPYPLPEAIRERLGAS